MASDVSIRSRPLLAVRERIWDESRTDVSVNAGEFVGAVRGPDYPEGS